jgi:hypothetical protein
MGQNFIKKEQKSITVAGVRTDRFESLKIR